MNTRRIAFALAAATAGILGVASVAWACVPGHDHGTAKGTSGHSVDPAVAPSLPMPTVAPAVATNAAPVNTGFQTASGTGSAAEEGSSNGVLGYAVVAVGGVLLLVAVASGLRKLRSGAGTRPVVD